MAESQIEDKGSSNSLNSLDFEDIDNLSYRVFTSEGISYLVSGNKRIDLRDIPNYYDMPKHASLENLPKWEKARIAHGLPLELAVQVALRKARIDFKGNPMNAHYPHSRGRHVDIETENMLIECTNIIKWLGFDNWQEKIDYFLKTDPKHRKKWIIVTTWEKCIPRQIRQQIANNNITLLLTKRCANSKNHNDIANELVNQLIQLNQSQQNNEPLLNNTLLNNTKNRYQTNTNNSLVPDSHVCVVDNLKNSSGLDG